MHNSHFGADNLSKQSTAPITDNPNHKKLEKVALDGSVESLRLRRDGVTLNFDLLTQKRNQVISVPEMHQWQKFGENPSTDTGDTAET